MLVNKIGFSGFLHPLHSKFAEPLSKILLPHIVSQKDHLEFSTAHTVQRVFDQTQSPLPGSNR
eukprot:Awhi_evm1s13776